MSIDLIQKLQPKSYAEIGVDQGITALRVCQILPDGAQIHLFDFTKKVENVKEKILESYPHKNFQVYAYGVEKGDYNWDLMKLVIQNEVQFDYIYLDGAHTLTIDGLAFILSDRLLSPGGYIEFDDYDWTIAGSPTCSPYPPCNNLKSLERFTEEQMRTPQVKLIVDVLVKTHPNYEEVRKNRIFRKLG